jgi:type I restriction-modification system DNA methylase subunit
MNSNYFIKKLGFAFDNQTISYDIKLLANNIGVDAVHCSGEFPAVFFKEVSDFNIDNLKEIAKIQRKIWNNSSVVFLYVVSPVEIRIYNCNETPVFFNNENLQIDKELKEREIETCKKSDKETLLTIINLFSAIAIDSGKVWISEYSSKIKLQTKVDRYLVNSLLKLAKKLSNDIEDDEIIHSLLMRSIFIMYLQDRKAVPIEIWDIIGENDFLKILDDRTKTYILFREIEIHFNGNVFPISTSELNSIKETHLKLLKHCLIDGDINLCQQKLFNNWRLFSFDFIRIELLSEIYENFLNEFDPIRKKETGTYYTPPSLVELVLDNVLPKGGTNYKLKIIDPACGSGIFLSLAYKRIINYWKNKHPNRKLSFTLLSEIMQNSIYGVEIDSKSIKVAAFSLYLALLDFLEPRDVWLKNEERFPYLIKDLNSDRDNDKKGNNLFCTDTIIENGDFEIINYDIVIGNPPFGTKKLPDNIKKYCEENSFDKQFVIPFIHKSVKLSPKGKIALLFNTKLLTNTKQTAQNFRRWLFNDNYVEKVYNLSILRKAPKDFGGHLFSSATVPVSIVCFRKNPPKNPQPTVEYWAPKTFIKNHVAEGVLIDNTDIKYLPREICQQPDTKIWKIAQWGTMADYFLIEKLRVFPVLNDLLDSNNNGVGLQTLDSTTKNPIQNREIGKIPFILPERINRFYTNINNTDSINSSAKTKKTKELYLEYYEKNKFEKIEQIDVFRRIGILNAYKSPHVLIKEGLLDNKVCASYLDYDVSFNSKVYGIYHEDKSLLKALTSYINSDFVTYFLFLTSASWGIEREEIKPIELRKIPQLPTGSFQYLSTKVDEIIRNDGLLFESNDEIQNQLNNAIFDFLEINEKEKIIIKDLIDYPLSLFFKGKDSIALKPIASKKPETFSYAEMLCNEINGFLKSGDFKVNAKVYLVSPNTPLSMVVLKFVSISEIALPKLINSTGGFEENLTKINNYTLQEYSQNIYVRKQVRYYEGDTIFIIKPNQKRFWTRSQGIEDAASVINELIAMDDDE